MNFDIAAVFQQLISSFTRLTLAQKIALPILVGGSVLLIVFISKWATRPDYAVLYSGLEQADAASVVEKLKDDKIAFQLSDNGTTVSITPPTLVNEMRLQLASMGLPKGDSVGYELFDDNAFGRTQFVEKLNQVRALQGELVRTIEAIEAVKAVRIHLTTPERSVFVKREVAPTASVLLKLRPGAELNKKQVRGIAHLVASSVERLTPENVTIVDSDGNILNFKRDNEESGGLDATKLEYKRKLEAEYSHRIETMLSEVLGPERALARVTADVDFSKREREEESYDPAGQVVRSSRSSEERASGADEGGVPGVAANLTNDPTLLSVAEGAGNRRVERVTNYEISRAVSRVTSATGTIRKLSVAVLVDGKYVQPTGLTDVEGAAQSVYQPLTAEMLRKIENLVKQTVGFDGARGDEVTVENIKFFHPDEQVESAFAAVNLYEMAALGMDYLLPALFIIMFFLFAVKPLVRFLTTPSEAEVDLSRLLPEGIESLQSELEAERESLMERADEKPEIDIEELEELLSENSRTVKENPEQAALLIRYWLNEGRM